MRPVQITRRGQPYRDPGGGVFVPDKRRGLLQPVYAYGPRNARELDPLFSCPVGVLERAHVELLEMWWICKSLGALPRAGGILDQPLAVLRSFPIFEAEHKRIEAMTASSNQAAGIASALLAVYGGGQGGGGRRR